MKIQTSTETFCHAYHKIGQVYLFYCVPWNLYLLYFYNLILHYFFCCSRATWQCIRSILWAHKSTLHQLLVPTPTNRSPPMVVLLALNRDLLKECVVAEEWLKTVSSFCIRKIHATSLWCRNSCRRNWLDIDSWLYSGVLQSHTNPPHMWLDAWISHWAVTCFCIWFSNWKHTAAVIKQQQLSDPSKVFIKICLETKWRLEIGHTAAESHLIRPVGARPLQSVLQRSQCIKHWKEMFSIDREGNSRPKTMARFSN